LGKHMEGLHVEEGGKVSGQGIPPNAL
jgi:hypothetical protein